MKVKQVIVFLLVLCIAGAVFAQGAQEEDDGIVRIVAISKTLDNPAFQVGEQGAVDRANELGNVEVEWTAPSAADPVEMVEMIESYVHRGNVDGLLVNSLGPAVDSAINYAMSRGIPVVMWDSDAPNSDRLTYVGADNYEGGYEAGKLYAEAVEGQGKQYVAILTGVPGAFNLQQRSQGFLDALDDLNVDYEHVVTVAGNDDLSESVEAVESTLRGNDQINGFFFNGPWPLLVDPSNLPVMVERIENDELTVVSFDTLEDQLRYVVDDLVIGLVGQKYYGWGYQGVTVLHEIIENDAEYPEFVNTGVDLVTKDGGPGRFSVDEFYQFWEDFSFEEEPILP